MTVIRHLAKIEAADACVPILRPTRYVENVQLTDPSHTFRRDIQNVAWSRVGRFSGLINLFSVSWSGKWKSSTKKGVCEPRDLLEVTEVQYAFLHNLSGHVIEHFPLDIRILQRVVLLSYAV